METIRNLGNICLKCGGQKLSFQKICLSCQKKAVVPTKKPSEITVSGFRTAVKEIKLDDPTSMTFEDSDEKKFGNLYEDLLFGEFHITRGYVQEALELKKRFGIIIPEEKRMTLIRKHTLDSKNNPPYSAGFLTQIIFSDRFCLQVF